MSARRTKPDGRDRQALRVWLQLLTLTTLVEKRIRRNLAAEFATTLPRFDVLASLERAQGRLTMGELSRGLLVSKGNITGVVGELERQGLVKRTRSSRDRRTHFVRLTGRGEKHFRALANAHRAWVSAMLGNGEGKRLQRLFGDLSALKAALTERGEEKAA